ncbi:MAG: hypothetical protein CME64_17165 [Halobacteriovoraceae bacterium]|nr:hypothetical protein [Halobacteriovoraceae bacterium]
MKLPFKRKLRNCIRKDTYQYYVQESTIQDIWKEIVSYFGTPRILDDFSLEIIEDERAIIKKGLSEAKFTLIKKSQFKREDEEFIARATGVKIV